VEIVPALLMEIPLYKTCRTIVFFNIGSCSTGKEAGIPDGVLNVVPDMEILPERHWRFIKMLPAFSLPVHRKLVN